MEEHLEEWLREFIKKRGRKPTILHIGNIANNAYQNAKILNERGYDCDVLCADYYHIGGCPEWDDADFTGDYKSTSYPAWHRVNLHGFKRPKWFIQGPFMQCRNYLIARRTGNKLYSFVLWAYISAYCRWQADSISFDINQYWYKIIIARYYIMRTVHYLLDCVKLLVLHPMVFLRRIPIVIRRKLNPKKEENVIQDTNEQKILEPYQKRLEALFPEYNRRLGAGASAQILFAKQWKNLLSLYDIVIAYADRCIMPYLAGYQNYIAYEHGTIRDLPYEDSDLGSLVLLAYAHANAIYVTNIDCVKSAEFISRDTKNRIIYGLHGIDIKRIINNIQREDKSVASYDARFGAAKEEVVFFSPTRVDIDPIRKTYLKGNDVIIQAAVKLFAEGFRFKLVLVRLGNDWGKIKEMIEMYPGLSDNIHWIEPVNKTILYHIYKNVDAILDQYLLPGMGAIPIEALCSGGGTLILYSIPEETMRDFFGAPIPVMSAKNSIELYECMKVVCTDRLQCKEYARLGREWIEQYHSSEKIYNALSRAIACCSIKV